GLETLDRLKSEFLANTSHELRTPLNAIIGYSELIEEDAEEPELRADVGRILEASRHLLELINDVLDLSKIEAGRMDLFYETIRVDTLIRGVADTIRPTIERNSSRLVLNLGGGLGTIESDLTKVRQILLNLASNAAKFTAGGTVEIVAREVRGDAGEAGLELAVRDSGIGIDAAKLAAIFEPFTQADASTTRRYGGTGLGLAITRRFVEMLGGTIDVTSVVGEGSCFTVWLPRRAPGAPARREGSSAWRLSQLEEASASMSMSVGPVSGLHVLVIDDDPEVHQRLRRLLVKEGCRVSVAASGAEGLEIARRDRPDLVTLDVVKRGADGWEVLCELKRDPALTGAPVRVISNAARSGELAGLAVADFVSTPLRGGHFAALLERAKTAGERLRVLIVDDEPAVREELREAVDVRHWEVAEASSGAEAVAALRDAPPDLLVLDLMMPVVDGFAVLERIASTPALRGLPVLVTVPQVLTIAEIYLLRERVLSLLQARGVDGEALLKEAVAELRERVALENSTS
ncbi:MAG: response regulator, partial [Myxococcales bacterium]|nr:response regulator [Myxococcales bacterium]